MTSVSDAVVQRSITVAASQARAFEVFTADFDSWWPRTHHIGKSPMTKAVIEGRVGGRCYNQQQDGTDCEWGHVLAWEPPARLVVSWQITHEWGYEPDLAKSSEVEIRFTDVGSGRTRVDLEHRHFERMGPSGMAMKTQVESPGGWGTLLDLFAARVAAQPASN